MSPTFKIIVGLVISAVYIGLNWILVSMGGALSFSAAFAIGPSSLFIGFVITIILAVILFLLYLFAMLRLVRTKKHKPSQVVHERIKVGQTYRHYKGHYYKVIAFGIHSDTGEEMIAYRREGDGHVFFRPLTMWFEEVEWEGKKVSRFTYIRG